LRLYQKEDLTPALEAEMLALFQDYYDRTPVGADSPPLAFNWPAYEALQQVGALHIYTAREDDKLIGLVFYALLPHMHHMSQMVATCFGLSVNLDMRGQGLGRKLIDFAKADLKNLGAHMLVHGARTCYEETPIFERLPGFRLREKTYSLDLT
jgi:GNAT superfamily N-acetyltransferase